MDKNYKNLSNDSQSLGWDLNQETLQHEARVLTTQLWYSDWVMPFLVDFNSQSELISHFRVTQSKPEELNQKWRIYWKVPLLLYLKFLHCSNVSSEPSSRQSLIPSHTKVSSMHLPDLHWNSEDLKVNKLVEQFYGWHILQPTLSPLFSFLCFC